VTLSYALNRYKWGTLERSSPSRFIGEIESEFLHYPQTGGKPFSQRVVFEPRPGGEADEQSRRFTPPARMTRLRDARVQEESGTVTGADGNRRATGNVPGSGSGNGRDNTAGHSHVYGSGQGSGNDLEPGDRVTHERFGQGEVISVEGEAPNTTALINFKTAGTKKLLLRFAKLTKL
jgi:DNA helicase-2/ATP-dependent DNA helicase PcrA